MTDTTYISPATPPAYGAATGSTQAMRRVSWGGIFAGAVVASALMVFFTTLGLGLGLSSYNPTVEANPLAGLGTGSGIYTIVTQLISLAIGGFIAARLAGVPRTTTSILHGATVWGVTTLLLAFLAITGGSAAIGTATNVVGTAARGAGNAVQAVIPDDLSLPNFGQLAGSINFDDLPPELQATLEEQGITPQNLQQEATAAFRNVITEDEQTEAVDRFRTALQDIVTSPGDAQADIQAAFDDLVGGPNAVLSAEDRQQALTTMETRLGVTPEEAEQLIAEVENRAQAAIQETRDAIEATRAQIAETAQNAIDAAATVSLLLALASILGLAAAAGGAVAGKPDDLVGDRLNDHV